MLCPVAFDEKHMFSTTSSSSFSGPEAVCDFALGEMISTITRAGLYRTRTSAGMKAVPNNPAVSTCITRDLGPGDILDTKSLYVYR